MRYYISAWILDALTRAHAGDVAVPDVCALGRRAGRELVLTIAPDDTEGLRALDGVVSARMAEVTEVTEDGRTVVTLIAPE